MTEKRIDVIQIDYNNVEQANDLVFLLNKYAQDPMGGGKPLTSHVKSNLASSLAKQSHAFTLVCYVDEKPAGLANCFMGFSTFNCQPLINIHDLAINAEFRGLGISQKLLANVESIAKQQGCCKITLEVLESNIIAKNAYEKYGFAGYELTPEVGRAMFWHKTL